MKKQFSLLFFLLFAFYNGQNNDIRNLVNTALNDLVPKDYKYYNLIDSSFIYNDYYIEENELEIIKKENHDFNFEELATKNKGEQQLLSWGDFNLDKAHIHTFKSLPEYETYTRVTNLIPFNSPKKIYDSIVNNKKNQLVIKYKDSWSKRQTQKKIDKAWKKHFNKIKLENRTYNMVSTPLILDNYAIITIRNSNGGENYIYRKLNKKWVQIWSFSRTVP